MSDTPRADAEVFDLDLPQSGSVVDADFARQLERELEAAKAANEHIKDNFESARIQDLQADLAAANTVIARMREAGSAILSTYDTGGTFGPEEPIWVAFRAALSLTPATVRDEVAAMRKRHDEIVENQSNEIFRLLQRPDNNLWETWRMEILAERDALRTRVEKAEADVARLDWLEENPIHKWGFGAFPGSVTMNGEVFTDVRAALDAARQPTPQPHEEGKR